MRTKFSLAELLASSISIDNYFLPTEIMELV